MSLVSHDLKCLNGHLHDSVLHTRGSMPACPVCGADTRISWHTGKAPGMSGFTVTTLNGKDASSQDIDAYAAQLERENPGYRAVIDTNTGAAHDQRIDSLKHRIYTHRKARGLDARMRTDHTVETLSKRIEDLDRGRAATKDVHRDIAKAEKTISAEKKTHTRMI